MLFTVKKQGNLLILKHENQLNQVKKETPGKTWSLFFVLINEFLV